VARLCRYACRPPVVGPRLSLTSNGEVRYRLKPPQRDGTMHVIFQPLDLLARLAALVPRPRVNLVPCYGVFAPNSRFRPRVTPAARVKGRVAAVTHEDGATPAQRMTSAQRLRRVFRIDVEKSVGQPICTAEGCRPRQTHWPTGWSVEAAVIPEGRVIPHVAGIGESGRRNSTLHRAKSPRRGPEPLPVGPGTTPWGRRAPTRR